MLLEGSPFRHVMDDMRVKDDAPRLMDTLRNQRTIAGPARLEGVGYWSGLDVSIEFRPAGPNSGIVFVRQDLPGEPRVPARIDYRVETPRRTTLRSGDASVEMVEHILAALAGLQIDNCEVWVDAAEMPGCDGSALPFVEAIDDAGIEPQDAPRLRRVIRESIRLGTADCWIEARPAAAAGARLAYELDYGPGNPIGQQFHEVELTPQAFRVELASCRTFVLRHEAEYLRQQGLGLRASAKDLLIFGPDGPIDNQLRFENECVRHKLLDMVGDLGLAGCDLVGQFRAYRSGHRHNAELVRALMRKAEPHASLRRSA